MKHDFRRKSTRNCSFACPFDFVVENFRTLVNALIRVRDYGGELSLFEIGLQESLLLELRKKLIDKKLMNGKIEERALTLSQLIEEWFDNKTGIDGETVKIYRQYCDYLLEHFGGGTLLYTIDHAKAHGFIPYLMKHRTVGKGVLANNAVHRCFRWVKPFFNYAVDTGHLTVSPFAKVKNVKYDKTQSQEHVELETIAQAIAACGDNVELRLVVAMAGYLGFRPSEMNDLTFDDFKPRKNGIIIRVPDTGKTGTRDALMFSEFLPYYEELLNYRKEGQVYVFAHYRKDAVKDFRNVATRVRDELEKAGIRPWRLFFNSLRGSCMTRKENLGIYTKQDMDAMFGNSDTIRQTTYFHGRKEEEYVARAGLYDSAAVSDERVKKSPLDSPYSGGIWGVFAYLFELAERRVMFSDLCKMLCKERGFDVDLFNEVVAANPAIGKMSSFVNSLLAEVYDDMPRKFSWLSFVWKCSQVASTAALLLMEFYKKFTVPQRLLEAQNGGQGIRHSACKSL